MQNDTSDNKLDTSQNAGDPLIEQDSEERFTISPYLPERYGVLRKPLAHMIDWGLGLKKLAKFYYSFDADSPCYQFTNDVLDGLHVTPHLDDENLARLPKEGPCIVVANHPHGMLDGLYLMSVLQRARPDFRLMANHFLAQYRQLRPLFVEVNPFGGKEAIRQNVAGARFATQYVRDGHMLVIFPAGEVSSLARGTRKVMDPKWDVGVARFIEKTNAPVVPMFIDGRNSNLFQGLGLIDPRLRTALMVREMMNKQGHTISATVGEQIEAKTLLSLGKREKIASYLRTKTYLLGTSAKQRIVLGRMARPLETNDKIVEPINPNRLEPELDELRDDQCLLTSGSFKVYVAHSSQIPNVVQEIGRLREVSFRAVGEGTGKKSDLDLFDSYYLHLFIWDDKRREIVGGYRLGHTDQIIDRYGMKGLYINSLFKLGEELKQDVRHALEVGRSFVSPNYQKNYSSLMLLWKGIATYVSRNPQYRILFGPVSISNDYHPVSQELLVKYLKHHNQETHRASQVKPRQPFRGKGEIGERLVDLDAVDLSIISDLLNTVEQKDKGVPVILRQYLKLGGQILGFNIDPEFNNSIDCLLWVDLMKTEPALLKKYMSEEGVQRFHAYHAARPDVLSAAS